MHTKYHFITTVFHRTIMSDISVMMATSCSSGSIVSWVHSERASLKLFLTSYEKKTTTTKSWNFRDSVYARTFKLCMTTPLALPLCIPVCMIVIYLLGHGRSVFFLLCLQWETREQLLFLILKFRQKE